MTRSLTQREQEAVAQAIATWSAVIVRLNGELITRDVPARTAEHLFRCGAAELAD